jgi:uncharacterized protein YbjT (DUF2867 family)
MVMNRKAVMAGATGLIGKELLHLLLENPSYTSVTSLVRRPTGIQHPKLHEVVIDFNSLNISEVDLTGADVFCTLGTTIKKAGSQAAFRQVDYTYPLSLGSMAKDSGAKQFFIVTAMGADRTSKVFYNRVKGEVEEALQGLGLSALKIFRPSLLLGDREEFRFGERTAALVSSFIAPLFIGPLKKYKPIQARNVAKAMVFAAQQSLPSVQVFESDKIAEASRE